MTDSQAHDEAAAKGWLWRVLPGLGHLRRMTRPQIRADVVAGVILAAYLLPSGIADASLANLPPEHGLYACLFGGLVFWLFCSSRQTVVTATSAISLMVGASLGELAGGESSRFAVLAACTAMMVGVMAFITWLIRAGVIVNFVSETVLLGFKCGIAFFLASTQLPKLFGFAGVHGGSFRDRIGHFFDGLHQTNPASLILGVSALVILLLGKRYLRRVPMALIVVVVSIVLAALTPMADWGVKLLGEVPQGLPALQLPLVSMATLHELLPLALACFLLGAVETAAIGRMFAVKHGYRYEPNREFLALAAANLAAAVGRGFPISGGMSQSLVNDSGGARTPLSGLVAALIIFVVVVFVSGALRDLPQPVLAAIVLVAVTGLVKLDALRRLWRFSRSEFAISMVATVGVLESGILRGVMIGALLSVALLLRRTSRPHTTELGRVAGSDFFADRIRHPKNLRVPGVFIFRVEAGLVYFNSEYVRDQFFELLNAAESPVRLAVVYLGTVPIIDLAGSEMLIELHHDLRGRGIDMRLAETHGQVRDALRRAGYVEICGEIKPNQSVASVIEEWTQAEQPR